jgi:hypothetical protein
LIDTLEHLRVIKLVYEFDLETQDWFPLHAATKYGGVISDRPYLIAIDELAGLSVGGEVLSKPSRIIGKSLADSEGEGVSN